MGGVSIFVPPLILKEEKSTKLAESCFVTDTRNCTGNEFAKAGGTELKTGYYHWSSTLYSSGSAWARNFSGAFGLGLDTTMDAIGSSLNMSNKYIVRPIVEF